MFPRIVEGCAGISSSTLFIVQKLIEQAWLARCWSRIDDILLWTGWRYTKCEWHLKWIDAVRNLWRILWILWIILWSWINWLLRRNVTRRWIWRKYWQTIPRLIRLRLPIRIPEYLIRIDSMAAVRVWRAVRARIIVVAVTILVNSGIVWRWIQTATCVTNETSKKKERCGRSWFQWFSVYFMVRMSSVGIYIY